jgi:transcriptional regulator of heat shock response
MHDRSAHILEAAIREFIEAGEPVSSGYLFDHYDFGIRPAMIRFEMNDLTERGYLEQPHHSAGRVPTNKGYEFFAQQVLDRTPEGSRADARACHLFEHRAWPEFLDELSDELGLLGAIAEFPRGSVYKEGLANLVNNFEWGSRSELASVIDDFEELDERLAAATAAFDDPDSLQIFIGRKSPITRSRDLAVVAGEYNLDGERAASGEPRYGRVLLCAIGPKRMNYQKAVGLLRGLQKLNQ